jgi:hypothetical protein
MQGKTIPFSQGEYPDLDGLEDGAQVKLSGTAIVRGGQDGQMSLEIQSMDFETEGMADREYKQMRGEQTAAPAAPAGGKPGTDF